MAENKKGFILYADQKELFEQLPDEKAGALIKHIFQYVNDEEPETNDLIVNLAFTPIKQQFKRDLQKWKKTREGRSKAGKASAEARKNKKQQVSTNSTSVNKGQQVSTNSTVNDNVNVNVTVNDNVNDIKEINFDKLLDFINLQTKRNFQLINNTIKNKYKARLKEGYTNESIKTAIINAVNSDYHKETNFKYLTPEFFSRNTTIDKYSEITNINFKKQESNGNTKSRRQKFVESYQG